LSHDEVKKLNNLVRHEMQLIASKSTDFNIEEKVLLCLKALGIGAFQSCSKVFLKVCHSTIRKGLLQFVNVMTTNA